VTAEQEVTENIPTGSYNIDAIKCVALEAAAKARRWRQAWYAEDDSDKASLNAAVEFSEAEHDENLDWAAKEQGMDEAEAEAEASPSSPWPSLSKAFSPSAKHEEEAAKESAEADSEASAIPSSAAAAEEEAGEATEAAEDTDGLAGVAPTAFMPSSLEEAPTFIADQAEGLEVAAEALLWEQDCTDNTAKPLQAPACSDRSPGATPVEQPSVVCRPPNRSRSMSSSSRIASGSLSEPLLAASNAATMEAAAAAAAAAAAEAASDSKAEDGELVVRSLFARHPLIFLFVALGLPLLFLVALGNSTAAVAFDASAYSGHPVSSPTQTGVSRSHRLRSSGATQSKGNASKAAIANAADERAAREAKAKQAAAAKTKEETVTRWAKAAKTMKASRQAKEARAKKTEEKATREAKAVREEKETAAKKTEEKAAREASAKEAEEKAAREAKEAAAKEAEENAAREASDPRAAFHGEAFEHRTSQKTRAASGLHAAVKRAIKEVRAKEAAAATEAANAAKAKQRDSSPKQAGTA